MEAHVLRAQGWSISALARHLGRDRKTVGVHLSGERTPGARRRPEDRFSRFEPYTAQRLQQDPHLRLSVLVRELAALGFAGSYQTLTREVRARSLRPRCEACTQAKGRATTEIQHVPGAETQWDWLELPQAPWGGTALVGVGALAHSGKVRGSFSEAKDTAHLIAAWTRWSGAWAGSPEVPDRRHPGRGDPRHPPAGPRVRRRLPVGRGGVDLCPPRRATARAWWKRPTTTSPSLVADRRGRHRHPRPSVPGSVLLHARRPPFPGHATVAQLASAERLRPVPRRPYHAVVQAPRKVSWAALVSFEGNRYSVPPEFVNAAVTVSWRLGEPQW